MTSVVAILCSAPERLNEVLRLPVDCEVSRSGASGRVALGLRWPGSKGCENHIKWVVPGMADVVRRALERLRSQSAEARLMAAWYEHDPMRLYLPPDLQHLRHKKVLGPDDLADLTGCRRGGGSRNLIAHYKLQPVEIAGRSGQPCNGVRFADFERLTLSLLPRTFPFIDPQQQLKFSEALLVLPLRLMRGKRGAGTGNSIAHSGWRCMFEALSRNGINGALGGKREHCSIFERLGISGAERMAVTSHQFRHYLNTLALRGGLSQLDVAKWSGRADVGQNAAYDHVSSHEITATLRATSSQLADQGSVLSKTTPHPPVPRTAFDKIATSAAHPTEIGFCVHDYTMLPCQRFRDCIGCEEHVCVKGDPSRTARLQQALNATRLSVEHARSAAADGDFGTGPWIHAHLATIGRLEQLLDLLNDASIPDGSTIRLGSLGRPTLIDLAVADRIALDGVGALSKLPAQAASTDA